jgi:hypothetical protein
VGLGAEAEGLLFWIRTAALMASCAMRSSGCLPRMDQTGDLRNSVGELPFSLVKQQLLVKKTRNFQ